MTCPEVQALSNLPVPRNEEGVTFVCCGIWAHVPNSATSADIWRAARQLEAFALDRPASLLSEAQGE